ncbi:MAG: hypothetical protein Alpg2KO_25350 [Alphaproteobacteria bacterium]
MGNAPPVHMIECADPDKFEGLLKELYPRDDIVLIDPDPLVERVSNSKEGQEILAKGEHGAQILQLFIWHEIETKIKQRAERNPDKPIILISQDLTTVQACDMTRRMSVVFEGRMHQWRVVSRDNPPEEPAPVPRGDLHWNSSEKPMKYAHWLMDVLLSRPEMATQETLDYIDYSLDDLLSMPQAGTWQKRDDNTPAPPPASPKF